jgi:flagellar protein FlaG
MGIQIAVMGSSIPRGNGLAPSPQHEFAQENLRRTQAAEKRKAAALARFESSLPGAREPAGGADLLSVSSDLERVSLAFNKRLQFMVDHESHDITVKVIDRETDKVIKVLPPEELQRMHDKIRETIGFLIDERA